MRAVALDCCLRLPFLQLTGEAALRFQESSLSEVLKPRYQANSLHIFLSQAFWHSTSHVLGEALEACFGVHLTIGPAIEEGFYYDSFMHGRSLTDAERPQLEGKIKQVSSFACTYHLCCVWQVSMYLHAQSMSMLRKPF